MNPITIPISDLKPALAGLNKVINKRLALPILGCVRIERTRTGHIELAATDLETSVAVRLDAREQGDTVAFLIPYEDLSNVAKSCGRHDTLIIAPPEGNRVAIKFPVGGQMIEHRCESLPVEEFPEITPIHGDPVAIDGALHQAIQEAFGCASVDPTRQVLNGVYLDVSRPQGHYVVATDGRHLFSSNSFVLPLKDSLIIPSHRFLGWKEFNNDGEWSLRASAPMENEPPRFEIASDHWRFVAQSLPGNYPNWRAVVPDAGSRKTTVQLDPEATTEILQTIARMPDHDPVHHSIGLEINGHRCWMLGKLPSAEQWTRIELTPHKVTGPDVKIFLNRQFLAKALRFGLTRIDVIDPVTPLRFSNGGRQMIVMPTQSGCERIAVQPVPASQPAPVPETSKPTETRKPMPENTATTIPSEKTPSTSPKPALDAALGQIETLKTQCRDTLRGLTELTDFLKQATREQRVSEKEVQSIRQTLRSLQSVRI